MVVQSHGRITWTDKSTEKEKKKFRTMYIRFYENYLKNFSDTFYVPGQSFDFPKIKIDPKHTKSLRKWTKHFCRLWEWNKVLKENTL